MQLIAEPNWLEKRTEVAKPETNHHKTDNEHVPGTVFQAPMWFRNPGFLPARRETPILGSRLHSLRPSSGYAGGIHPNVPQNGRKSQSASLVKRSWEDPSAFMR